jgi:hypothetical protein
MNATLSEPQSATLCDALDRLLNTGVSVHGDITISVAEVDLLTISLRGLIAAVDAVARSQSEASPTSMIPSERSEQAHD